MEKKRPFIKLALLLPAAGILTASLFSGMAQQRAATPHTLLWRISGKGLTKPSYLFGTMHVLCADEAVLSDSLKAAISGCDQIYFEIDLSDMSGMLGALKYMRMNGGQKLSDLLDSTSYTRVKRYFSKHASMLPFGMLERFKPMLISGIIEENNMNCKTTDGMELKIMSEARPYNKPVRGLETAEFQAGLFDSIPYEKQAKELVSSIDSADENRKSTLELETVYKQQDLDKIDALSSKDDQGMNEYMDLLLYGRNRKWAKNLETLLPGKSLLIAVGAAHLPGNQGVIALLRKEGYTVEPVRN
jgi:uncharacterized protein YbaP (TraB family)